MAHRAQNSVGLLFNEAIGQAAWRYSPQSSRLVLREQHGGQPSPKKKGTGPSMTAGLLPMLLQHHPLVTTGAAGGGAFPLPMYCAQPAMLSRASTAAIPRESFFIAVIPLVMTYPEHAGRR